MVEPNRLFHVFNAALDLVEDERTAYVREACADDEALAEQVLAMLAADAADGQDDFLEGPASEDAPNQWGQYESVRTDR